MARKVARKLASGEADDLTISPEDVRELLGRPRVHPERANEENEIGVAAGMYYTPMGGDIMFVEASTRSLSQIPANEPGGGAPVALVLTGQLGDVMKESANIALSYLRSHADAIGITPDAFTLRKKIPP